MKYSVYNVCYCHCTPLTESTSGVIVNKEVVIVRYSDHGLHAWTLLAMQSWHCARTQSCKHIHNHSAHITHDRRDDRWHSIATAVMIVCRLWLTRICRNSTCLYYIAFTMPILIRSGWALYYVGPNAECVWVERWVDCGSAWMSACMSCVPGEFSCLFSYSGSTSTSA